MYNPEAPIVGAQPPPRDIEQKPETTSLADVLTLCNLKKSPLYQQTQAEVEAIPFRPGDPMPAYGSLPHFDEREEIITHLPSEIASLKGAGILAPNTPPWKRSGNTEGIVLYWMKTGRPLSALSEEILKNYPDLGSEKLGKLISVFGLSGSGKSTLIDAVKEFGNQSIVITDSDTSRFNLLAKDIKDAEPAMDDARLRSSGIIHNKISGSLYCLLGHVNQTLKERGYTVINCSTAPQENADELLYIEHPDGINPQSIREEDIPQTAQQLWQRTQERTQERDSYDWANASTVTNFNEMIPVSVQVPLPIHQQFIRNLGRALREHPEISHLYNPAIADPEKRNHNLFEQIRPLL